MDKKYENGGGLKKLRESIPGCILEWKAREKDRTFDRNTIFNYLDGGSEPYLAYDFRQVLVRKYANPGGDEMVLDIYDMGSSAEAFGIFSSEREEKEVGIGQGSEYSEGLLRTWKDRFFVSILAIGNENAAKPAVMELGKAVANAIPSKGPEPELLKYLPQNHLQKNKTRYFHTELLLSKHYFIADENILDLSKKTNCVLASYRLNNQDFTYLLLIRYETGRQAKKAYETFIHIYMPEARETGCARMENQTWTTAAVDQYMVKIVFEAPDKKRALELHSAVKPVIR